MIGAAGVPQPWDATEVVDEARAAALVAAQFPELAGAPVRLVATGWDNTVLRVGEVLFRFPRRDVAVELQEHELAVLPRIAAFVPLAVPVPTHVGAPGGAYPWPFWGAAPIAGEELALRPGVDRRAAAEALGGFLRVLHGLAVDVELPVDPTRRGSPAERVELTRRWLDDLAAQGVWSWSPEVSALVDCSLAPPDEPPVLVHGDLHLRHLLVDDAGRATGVIDWGDTCFADPSVDLSLLYSAFTGADREAGLAAYGPVPAEREQRARSLAVGLSAAIARWAAATGEPQLLQEYLRGIERATA